MRDTDNLGMKILDVNVEQEKTREVITEYSKNFEIIDKLYSEGNDLASLNTGQIYPVAEKLWNSAPAVGSPVGWVNIRNGTYANPRRQNTSYQVGDFVASYPDNHYYYECVSAGKTPNRNTVFLGSNLEFYDVKNVSPWRPSTTYVVDEVVMATDGTQIFYYIVEVAGTSGLTEPDWSSVGVGISLVDSTVTWRKERNPKWIRRGISAHFKPFGIINN